MKKDKIKKRFEQQANGETVRIPAKAKYDKRKMDDRTLRVAAYCRVSTDTDEQYTSFEAQVQHYTESVGKHHNWELFKVYADEGISGTSTKKRDQYLRMMADARAGKFDIIITKTVSRFTRNTVDGLKAARELLHLSPPIGIYFEEDKFNTLMPNSEFLLTIMLSLAQGESTKKSESMLTSYEWRYNRDDYFCPTKYLLGYDTDDDGNMVIEPDGAKTVRAIFTLYLAGNSASDIAHTLTELQRPTGKNNLVWSSSSVMNVIRNEKYCGDVLAPKSRVVDVLEHIRSKNKGQEDFFYSQNHHPAIVSREEYIRALILSKSNRRSCHFNPDYEMRVISEGLLTGFIPINCAFGGYDAGHYMSASDAIVPALKLAKSEVAFIEGCEIARAQEFESGVALATISSKAFSFNKECVDLLPKTEYVELLIHPNERLLAVRKTTADNRNAIPWASGSVSSAVFMPMLFELCGWCDYWRYRTEAVCLAKRTERVLVFDLSETETIVCEKPVKKKKVNPDAVQTEDEEPSVPVRAPQTFKPAAWMEDFGVPMASAHSSCRRNYAATLTKWHTNAEARPVNGFENAVPLPTSENIRVVLQALEV
ncbi:resolvase [Clostridia bacterium]|nr:resolvase [Clostridia bacterium]